MLLSRIPMIIYPVGNVSESVRRKSVRKWVSELVWERANDRGASENTNYLGTYMHGSYRQINLITIFFYLALSETCGRVPIQNLEVFLLKSPVIHPPMHPPTHIFPRICVLTWSSSARPDLCAPTAMKSPTPALTRWCPTRKPSWPGLELSR